MKRRCVGFKKNLNRCSRAGDWKFFCHDHKRQPIVWGFVFVFTVLGGGASILSIVETKVNQVKTVVEPKGSTDTSEYPFLSLRGVINNENLISFAIASDVALIALFDPMALEHRLRDQEDWWIDDSELIREMNRGNGIFISTGVDGYFEVLVHGKGRRIGRSVISMNFVCEGEQIYVGGHPHEGLDKNALTFGGDYFSCVKGVYQVEIRRKSNMLGLSFVAIDKFSRNSFEKIPHFDELD